MSSKIVLLTQRHQEGKFNRDQDSIECTYIRYFEKLGYIPILISAAHTKNTLSHLIRLCDFLVLTGGGDPVLEDNNHYSELRERQEKNLIELALDSNTPILGICKGFQTINLFFGGKLKRLQDSSHIGVEHSVQLYKALDLDLEVDTAFVNSFHNYVIEHDDLSAELIPIAYCVESNTIEAFIHRSKLILGIQWHPERYINQESREVDLALLEYLNFKSSSKHI